ncbi:hypothetical protein MMC17_005815 [Xylographa soralifera]|nr:hypothetical protein [Xylographa soralifera]
MNMVPPLPDTTATLHTLPTEIRRQIFANLIPDHEIFHLGFSEIRAQSKDMDEEGDRRPHPRTKTWPSVSGALNISRVCRTFDQEYTTGFYRRFAFVIENTTESFGAGMLFLINLRPSTATCLTDLFVYHIFWNVDRSTADILDTVVKESKRFKLARAAFCTAASAMSLQHLHIFVSRGSLPTKQYASLQASWLKPFLTIKGVAHFGMTFFNRENKENRALFRRFLDELNASGVMAEYEAYTYYPRLTDVCVVSKTPRDVLSDEVEWRDKMRRTALWAASTIACRRTKGAGRRNALLHNGF